MTPDERIQKIEENMLLLQATVEKHEELGVKTDKRLNSLLTIVLKIGSNFAQRLQDLEEEGN